MKKRINVQDIFTMEELLPVVAALSDKYTSKESSSVTYETANMLMEAVLYCIQECLEETETSPASGERPDALQLYKKGCAAVVRKVKRAEKLYEGLTEDFADYGCRNYRDTVLKGIPAFFMKYDAGFCPQNHIITLDYPSLHMNPELCGVDLIYDYLQKLLWEKQFLECFSDAAVSELLNDICPDFQELYLDNICYPVLHRASEALILDKVLSTLEKMGVDGDYFRLAAVR